MNCTSISIFTSRKCAHCLVLPHLWFQFPLNLSLSWLSISCVILPSPHPPVSLYSWTISLARIWNPCVWTPAVCATAWRHHCPAHCVCDSRPAKSPGQRLLGLLHLHLAVLLPATWSCCSHLLHLCESDSTRFIFFYRLEQTMCHYRVGYEGSKVIYKEKRQKSVETLQTNELLWHPSLKGQHLSSHYWEPCSRQTFITTWPFIIELFFITYVDFRMNFHIPKSQTVWEQSKRWICRSKIWVLCNSEGLGCERLKMELGEWWPITHIIPLMWDSEWA